MLDNLFNPKSVAVIGASDNEKKWGYQILDNLINSGFKGVIYPINPKTTEILGCTCFKSILEVDDTIDLAVIVIPSKFVSKTIDECGQMGIKNVVIISAGFSEVGNTELEQEIVDIVKCYDMNMIGPNTFGVISKDGKMNISLIKRELI